jgi:peptidyl-prolyl cis-trans isomerase SurA
MLPTRMFRYTLLAGALSWGGGISLARATIVERVVAVVGERPILLSELRRRAAPFTHNISGSASSRAKAQSQLYTEMLERMIDEELVRRAASKAQLEVTREEIDAAIERVAAGNSVSMEELLEEVARSGVALEDYRRELSSQLLDAKVMNVRLQERIRIAEDEVRAKYDSLVAEERKQAEVRLAVVRMAIPRGAAPDEIKVLVAAARRVALLARSGEDFAELSRKHSTDAATQAAGGLLPAVPAVELPPHVRAAVSGLDVGQVSVPLISAAMVTIIKVVDRPPSSLPAFEEVIAQLQQRVQLQKMEKARRTWLDALRKSTHVEIRL